MLQNMRSVIALRLMAVVGLASALIVPNAPSLFANLSIPILSASRNNSLTSKSSMSIKAWADAARRGPYRQSWAPQHAISVLEYLFDGKEAPNKASTTIASLYDPLLKQGFTVSPVFGFWAIICEAVRMLGGIREIDERLIALLNAMWRLPDVTDHTGRPIGPGGGFSGVYWKDLPGLAITFREYAIGWYPVLYCDSFT